MFKNWKINQINETAKNLQTCTILLDLDTFTALVGQSVTLTARVYPPGIYDIIFKVNGDVVNPPIPTDPSGIATLLLDSTGQSPGLYEFIAEVIGPVPNSCISAPLTGALTTTQCTGITIDTHSPITVHQGDIISTTVTATVTEQSVVEFRETTSGQRVSGCIISPPGGSCTITGDTTGAPPGTYYMVASIGNGEFQQCVSDPIEVIILQSTCTSITIPTATPSTVIIGDTVTLTATVQPTTLTFNVVFKDQYNNVLGTANTISGVATLQWNTAGRPAGIYNIKANVGTQCSSSAAVSVTLNTCTMTMTEADTYTVVIGSTITLTTKIDPPGTYFVDLKVDDIILYTTPITTDSYGMVTLPFVTTDQPPGLHNLLIKVVGPHPMSCENLIPIALTTADAACTITIDTPSPIIVHEGGTLSISATATVTEQSVVEFRETTSDQRIENCTISPPGGQCTVTIEIPIGAPPGTFGVVAKIGNGPAQQCASNIVSVILEAANICQWITSKGGWNSLRIFDIMILVSAYLGQTNLGFAIAIVHIMGGVSYYLNNPSSGDSLTGCSPI